MLVIRLARGGRAKYPTYRIVAAESARAATGKFVEVLGHYNPHTKELVVNKEETQKRLSNGAQPSNSVIKLLQRENVKLPTWVKLKTKNKNPKKEPVEKATMADAKPVGTEESEVPAPAEETVVAVAADHAEAVASNKIDDNTTETAEHTEEQADASQESSKSAADNAEETTKN